MNQGWRRDKIIFSRWGGPKNIFSRLRQHAWRGKSLKLYKQIYETLNFEMVDVPGLTTRQNNFLVVGGAQKNIFFLYKQIYIQACWLKKKKNIFLGPPPTARKLFCLVVNPGT